MLGLYNHEMAPTPWRKSFWYKLFVNRKSASSSPLEELLYFLAYCTRSIW